jgi:hypothetical protein
VNDGKTGVGARAGNKDQAETKHGDSKKPGSPPKPKLAPRKRVHQAQLNVLEQVDKILTGNCKSATKGNYSCAKFVLDWSGVSDIRTPLAKPLKQKTMASTLLKQLKKTAAQKQQLPEDKAAPK